MTCEHCNAAEQRGRYCVGCGKLLPPQHLRDDDTQPSSGSA
jgi:methionyl-tRNA synthetase